MPLNLLSFCAFLTSTCISAHSLRRTDIRKELRGEAETPKFRAHIVELELYGGLLLWGQAGIRWVILKIVLTIFDLQGVLFHRWSNSHSTLSLISPSNE